MQCVLKEERSVGCRATQLDSQALEEESNSRLPSDTCGGGPTGSEVQDLPPLQSDFKASLGYLSQGLT